MPQIGTDLTIYGYSQRRKTIGRYALYLSFNETHGVFYIMDVFPNVIEHFDIVLRHEATYHEEGNFYTDSSGSGRYEEHEVFDSIEDALMYHLKGKEVELW